VKILSISFRLTRYIDLKTALEALETKNVQNNIHDIREKCNVEFQQLFLSVIRLCEKFDINVSLNDNINQISRIFLKSQYLYLL